MNAFKQTASVYSHNTQHPRWDYWGSDANQSMMKEFMAAIREHRRPTVTGHDGYQALEITMAAYHSVEKGIPVRLPLE